MLSLKNIFLKFINNILFFLSGTVFVSFTFLVTGKISSVILAILLLLIYSCIRDCSLKEYKTIATLNGYLLPAKRGGRQWIRFRDAPERYYRVKEAVLYDPDSKRGFAVKRDYKAAARCLAAGAGMILRLKKKD